MDITPGRQCPVCTSALDEGSAFCPFCGSDVSNIPTPAAEPPVEEAPVQEASAPKQKKKWSPGPVARVFLRLGTTILSILLTVALTASILSIDMHLFTSENTIQRMVETALQNDSKGEDSAATQLQNVLVDVMYDAMKEGDTEDKITASKEQISEFLTRSDAAEFLGNKLSGLTNDLINGTDDTHIRSSDVIKLLDRNSELAEDIFGKDVNTKMKEDIKTYMSKHDVDRTIHKELFPALREKNMAGILSISALLDFAQLLSSTGTLILLIILDLILIGLLLLTNWLRLSATMRCVGTCCVGVGGTFSALTLIVQLGILPLSDMVGAIAQLLASVVALPHYITLGLGIVLLLTAVIVRIIEGHIKHSS